MLSGSAGEDLDNLLLLDVTPLSLGIATGADDDLTLLIERNDPLPIR